MSTDVVSSADERRAGLLDALGRIRHLKDSKLENQRASAQLLVAIEATLLERAATDSQHAEPGPTQYLLALESLLNSESTNADILGSSIYLLSIVLPYVTPGVVRAKSHALLIAVAVPLAEPHGASENMNARLRASLSVVDTLLSIVPVQERATLERERTWLTVWDLVLNLCMDARPKVRRRAHEVVTHILGLPSWEHAHPYAERTMAWAARTLHSVAAARGVSSTKASHKVEFDKHQGKAKHARSAAAERQKQAADGAASTGIWVCALLQTIVPLVPMASTTPLVHELLTLPALQNPFLTVSVYDVFAVLFRTPRTEASLDVSAPVQRDVTLLRHTLDALQTNVPAHTDVHILPAYLNVLESCMVAYSAADIETAWSLTPALWKSTMQLALSASSDASRSSADVRIAGRKLLQALARYCIPDHAVAQALTSEDALFAHMIRSLRDAFGKHALRYTHTRSDILHILASMLRRLRYPLDNGGVPPAEPLLMSAVEDVAALRVQRNFDARPDADAVLGAAISACGPRAFLKHLPLDLLDQHGRPNTQGGAGGARGRAWLLPLLREHISNTELAHFVEELVPLSEALFEVRVRAEQPTDGSAPRPVEVKVMEALIEQIWVCFPGYCDLCRDIDTALTPRVLELLVNVLRTQSALRPAILKGLQLLVQRTESVIASQVPSAQLLRQFGVDQNDGRRFLEHLRSMSGVLLASLFQLLTELPAQSRGYVMECVATYLAILDAPSISKTFAKVAHMLQQALATYHPSAHAPTPGKPEPNSPRYVPPVPHTMLDLFIVLVPYVHGADAASLFDACMHALQVDDSGLQKKAYRALSRLLDGKDAAALRAHVGCAALVSRYLELDVPPGAVRDRLALFRTLVPHMPDDDLGTLAALVPEAVLGTKEANQGAREEAYALLVDMGHCMARGGRINRAQAGTDVQDIVAASVPEYVMMVAAGLAGASPRMIGASITALARLLYEFHLALPDDMLAELLTTMLVYLESTNREIVKASLGFCKVATLSLSPQQIEQVLPSLVPALLQIRHVHKNHFKAQVRHLMERLLRRFGEKAVSAHVDPENQRLIANIRKRKERAKRRRAHADGGEDETEPVARSGGMDAFEDALYGSDSDDSDEEEEEDAAVPRRSRHREDDTYLLEDDDAPMDLLDEAAVGAIRTNVRHKARRQPGQEAKSFETDESGRMRISEHDHDADQDTEPSSAASQAGRAYMEREMGVDGLTFRGRGGSVKFNKNNKRTRANERMDDEDEEESNGSNALPRQKKKRGKQAIGSEFKARRAEGDVQKGGMSPYAYVPLSAVAGKRNAKKASSLAITGKRRKAT